MKVFRKTVMWTFVQKVRHPSNRRDGGEFVGFMKELFDIVLVSLYYYVCYCTYPLFFLIRILAGHPSGTSERTREVVLDGMKKIHEAFQEHDLIANVRLETYEGERYYHVPPPAVAPSSSTKK